MSNLTEFCFLILLCCGIHGALSDTPPQSEFGTWCHKQPSSYNSFQKIMELMNVTEIKEEKMEWIINTTLLRAGCDLETKRSNLSSNSNFSQCTLVEGISKVLDVQPGSFLNEDQFDKLSIILFALVSDLPRGCSKVLDWNNTTLEYFIHQLMSVPHSDQHGGEEHRDVDEHHNDDDDDKHNDDVHDEHHHIFHTDQLETVLRNLSKSYRPGYKRISDVDEEDRSEFVRNVCYFQNTRSFNSLLIKSLVNSSSDAGFNGEEEIGEMSSIVISKLLHGECISMVDKEMPAYEDFLISLFHEYSEPETCTININGLQKIARALNIAKADETEQEHDDDVHDDDNHDHHHVAKVKVNNQEKGQPKNYNGDHVKQNGTTDNADQPINSRQRRDTHEHNHGDESANNTDVKNKCFSLPGLVQSVFLDSSKSSFSRSDLMLLCPVLLQQAVQGCPRSMEDPHPESIEEATSAQAYGYGTVSVLIMSLCCLAGLIIVRWRHTSAYRYIMSLMLGLGVSSLVGDALLHLVPHALELHDHGSEEEGHGHDHGSESRIMVEPFLWKMLCACGSIWFYYILQLVLLHIGKMIERKQERKNGIVTRTMVSLSNPAFTDSQRDLGAHNHNNYQLSHVEEADTSMVVISGTGKQNGPDKHDHDSEDIHHAHSTVAWMITFGDAIHNFADGLALGAAFSKSWKIGLSTSIAIIVHELPHEFGDTAILLSSGWSVRKVIICQLLSQATAFIGLYISVSISEHSSTAQQWIFSVTCGIFLYVALANIEMKNQLLRKNTCESLLTKSFSCELPEMKKKKHSESWESLAYKIFLIKGAKIPELVEYFSLYNSALVFITSNVGLALGFAAMLIIAIFEEHINI